MAVMTALQLMRQVNSRPLHPPLRVLTLCRVMEGAGGAYQKSYEGFSICVLLAVVLMWAGLWR